MPRRAGLRLLMTTIQLLDDTVAPQYVAQLRHYARSTTLDLVTFRMYDFQLPYKTKVTPRIQDTTALRNYVGISFAFKRTGSDADYFVDSINEDYDFIHKYCRRAARRLCLLSSDVTYFVKGVKPSVELFRAGKSGFFTTDEDNENAMQSHIARGRCLDGLKPSRPVGVWKFQRKHFGEYTSNTYTDHSADSNKNASVSISGS